MSKAIKPADKGKPAKSQQKPEIELDEKALDKVTGGKLGQACVTGQHIKGGVITT